MDKPCSWNTIANALSDNSSLREMRLDFCLLTMNKMKSLIQAISTHPTLESLNLSNNPFDDEGCVAVANFLQHSSSLKKLKLVVCGIRQEGSEAMANFLCQNSSLSLEHLNMSLNELTPAGSVAIANALVTNTSLNTLILEKCDIDIRGAKAMADALDQNSSLQYLDLSNNDGIGDQGCIAISEVLLHSSINSSLETLILEKCDIGAEGAKSLADVLRHNNAKLRRLNLSSNPIGDVGCTAISNGLLLNSSLKVLRLSRCFIGAEGVKAMANALSTNCSLENLDISNRFGDDAIVSLANALQSNMCLKILHLRGSSFGKKGRIALEMALCRNYTLQELNLNFVFQSSSSALSTTNGEDGGKTAKKKRSLWENLEWNKENPLEAEAVKMGMFPSRLLPLSWSAPCFVQAMAKLITFDDLSVLHSFLREQPVFALVVSTMRTKS